MRTVWITHLKDLLQDDSGAAAIEYGIIAMALAVAIIPAIYLVASSLQGNLASIAGLFTSL